MLYCYGGTCGPCTLMLHNHGHTRKRTTRQRTSATRHNVRYQTTQTWSPRYRPKPPADLTGLAVSELSNKLSGGGQRRRCRRSDGGAVAGLTQGGRQGNSSVAAAALTAAPAPQRRRLALCGPVGAGGDLGAAAAAAILAQPCDFSGASDGAAVAAFSTGAPRWRRPWRTRGGNGGNVGGAAAATVSAG